MIYLDSAIISEAEIAIQLGWVKGITTNPTLLPKSHLSPKETLSKLAEISPGELYYQLTATNFNDAIAEAKKAFEIIGDKTVLKIPATKLGFQLVSKLSPDINCSVTAIYHPAQAAVAKELGAKYAIAYVNRATKLLGDGIKLVQEMATILQDSDTKILAASIKSPTEAAAALSAGATNITLPLQLLESLTTDELSEKTVEEFNKNGIGINY